MSPRPQPKISLRHDWTKELGSKVDRQPEGEVARQPEGEVARQAKFFQPTELIPNPIRDRSGRPDEMHDERKTSRSQEISVNSFTEETSSSDRTGRPVETEEIQARSSEDSKSLNVEQTHDRAGRPVKTQLQYKKTLKCIMKPERSTLTMKHFVKEWRQTWTSKFQDYHILIVKHAQSTSVRQLIQKIENHPNRHALQQDLRQNQLFNPFSPESKQMIRDVGNIELCELLETEPKT